MRTSFLKSSLQEKGILVNGEIQNFSEQSARLSAIAANGRGISCSPVGGSPRNARRNLAKPAVDQKYEPSTVARYVDSGQPASYLPVVN